MPNALLHETSPYLLQHANNPVEWYPWGEEALAKAKAENKLILVSIGYSACHWCHVMEHESFEDEAVAEIMNQHFVCIKIDREERPDIDQIYMYAVQLMTGSGGWPLNCICLPDQRPIYGGTYFRKEDWKKLLLNLAAFWSEKPTEAEDYAVKLTEGIRESEKITFIAQAGEYAKADLEAIYEPWKAYFDWNEGGYNRAPKFPLPNNWQFLLRYGHLMKNEQADAITHFTLQKMAFGGIYDHIGGGFARYSVDNRWHVPHFEKMLYDNAQLVSLYAEAYQQENQELYKSIVYETLDWVSREMTNPSGGFYSALDADSEGVEGKFYTFHRSEIEEILGADAKLFCAYYGVSEAGNWAEEETNVLMRSLSDEKFAAQHSLKVEEWQKKLKKCKDQVFSYRDKRVKPGLDDKILAAWNGMMLKGFADAYRVFGETHFLQAAIKNADFIWRQMRSADGGLFRNFKAGKATITAFLDDYAFVIDGLIALYEATFEEQWLAKAKQLTDYALHHFSDESTGMFFYTSDKGETLIARKQEIMDNVIPGSNSVMANNLFKLGYLFNDQTYLDRSAQQLRNVQPQIKTYGSAYSNWANLLLNEVFGVYEIAITGPDYSAKRQEIEKYYIPNKILLGGSSGSLPLLQDKWGEETRVFVCRNKTCQLPVTQAAEAIKQIQ
ncbi:MAG: thioredoxin domain-containing protein [Sphingobacteriaceae bacterium]